MIVSSTRLRQAQRQADRGEAELGQILGDEEEKIAVAAEE